MSAFEATPDAERGATEGGRSDGETARPAETLLRRRLGQAAAAFRIELGQQLRGLGAVGLALLALLLSLPWVIAWLPISRIRPSRSSAAPGRASAIT